VGNPVRLGAIPDLKDDGKQCMHEPIASSEVSRPLMPQPLQLLWSLNLIVVGVTARTSDTALLQSAVSQIRPDSDEHAGEERTLCPAGKHPGVGLLCRGHQLS
jgi:hypothetical protein